MPETNRIEYKRELNIDVDIEKEVIAFLNYHEGGVILSVLTRHSMVGCAFHGSYFDVQLPAIVS